MPANIIQRLKDECLSSDQILESIEKIMKEKSKESVNISNIISQLILNVRPNCPLVRAPRAGLVIGLSGPPGLASQQMSMLHRVFFILLGLVLQEDRRNRARLIVGNVSFIVSPDPHGDRAPYIIKQDALIAKNKSSTSSCDQYESIHIKFRTI